MLQSWPFNVNITNKTPRFIGFMKSACRFGPSNEKTDFSTSLHHQEYYQYQKSLLKLSGGYDHWMKSVQIRSFFRSYFPAFRLVHICPHSVCIRRFTEYISIFNSNAGKIRTRKNTVFGHFLVNFSKGSIFKVQTFWRDYSIVEVQIIFKFWPGIKVWAST